MLGIFNNFIDLLACKIVVPWLFCFIGYPAVFMGLFGGGIYLYNHEFI